MEQLRRGLTLELPLCRTKRDVNRVFDAAEEDVRTRGLNFTQCRQVLSEIETKLPSLLPKEKRAALIEEARLRIHTLLRNCRG